MPKIFKDKNNNVLYTGYETSEIVANPTLAGTEATLTGIQVGNTKFKVPEGGGSSLHTLIISQISEDHEVRATMKVKDSNITSWSDLLSYLRNNGFESAYSDDPSSKSGYDVKMEICNGYTLDTQNSYQIIMGITAFDDDGYGISLITSYTAALMDESSTYYRTACNFDGTWLYESVPTTFTYLD